jgi:hypothetical protein
MLVGMQTPLSPSRSSMGALRFTHPTHLSDKFTLTDY